MKLKEEIKEALSEFFNEQGIEFSKSTDSPLITKKDIARIFGVSVVTVCNWEAKGLLPNRIVRGRKVFFNKHDVLKELENKS